MRYYPIFLDLRGRRCTVVGGGRVAERKVQALLRAGANVRVISPAVTPRLALLAARKKIDAHPARLPHRRSGRAGVGAAGRLARSYDPRWSSPPPTAPRRRGPSAKMRRRSGRW